MLIRRQTAAGEPQEFVSMDGRLQLLREVGEIRNTLGGGFRASPYRFEAPLSKIARRGHIGIAENGVGLVEVMVKGVEAIGVDVAVGLDAGQENVEDLSNDSAKSVPGPRLVAFVHGEGMAEEGAHRDATRRATSSGGAGRPAAGGILRSKS